MKKKIIFGIILIIVVIFSLFLFLNKNFKKEETKNYKTTNDINIELNTLDDDAEIDWDKYQKKEINLTESIKINEEGVYYLSGKINNGNITIDTSSNVKLVLDNVNINNNSGPAILVNSAKNVVIELKDGSISYLSDGFSYKDLDEDISGSIYSKDDLILEGTGTLNIKANYKDGIVSKDDLKIINGTYNILANGEGIRGKDSLYIAGGTYNITSKDDAGERIY